MLNDVEKKRRKKKEGKKKKGKKFRFSGALTGRVIRAAKQQINSPFSVSVRFPFPQIFFSPTFLFRLGPAGSHASLA